MKKNLSIKPKATCVVFFIKNGGMAEKFFADDAAARAFAAEVAGTFCAL